MASVSMNALDGGRTTIASERLESLRAGLRGRLCLPGDPGYDEARAIWNGVIDRRPAGVSDGGAGSWGYGWTPGAGWRAWPPTARSATRASRTTRICSGPSGAAAATWAW